MTPLAYMLAIMNDPDVDVSRRDRMAIAAAPFCHERPTETGVRETTKARAQKAAATAERGTSWEKLLTPSGDPKLN